MVFIDSNPKKDQLEVATRVSDLESLSSALGEAGLGTVSIDKDSPFYYESQLASTLSSRHITMITLVGVFGTGLFLSSGGILATAGPVGMLLAYFMVAIVVMASQMCVTELACLMPVTAGYVKHAEHFCGGPLSFMLGWLSVYSNILPVELSAAALVVSYWSPINPAVWITILGLTVIAVNSYKIRWYGEIEFFFGCLKISLIVGLVVAGIVIDLGGGPNGDRLGFRYWKEGAFNWKFSDNGIGRFAAFWKTVLLVVYSYGGIQSIALLSGEVEYPRRAIHRAGKRAFFRAFFLYMSAVFVLTLLVSSKNPDIANSTGNAAGSPFVIAIKISGIKVLPHIINAIVLTSALSAQNLSIVGASRNLYALASKGQAPKIFLKVNRHGMPYVSVIFSCIFMPIAYLSANNSSATVFGWLQNLTSSNLLAGWIVISANHICMTKAMKVQGYSRADLPYRFPGTTYAAWFSLFMSTLFLLTGGFANFVKGNFVFSSFFSAYFEIPLALVLFLGYAIFTRTFWKRLEDVDLKSLFDDVIARPEPAYPKLRGWRLLTVLYA